MKFTVRFEEEGYLLLPGILGAADCGALARRGRSAVILVVA